MFINTNQMKRNMSPQKCSATSGGSSSSSRIDKENVRHLHSSSSSSSSSSRSLKTTPTKKTKLVFQKVKTPPSKLLRRHFQQQRKTTSSPISTTTGNGSSSRQLESGPVRIQRSNINKNDDDDLEQSFLSMTSSYQEVEESMLPTRDCMDPVAITLLLSEDDDDEVPSWEEEPSLQSWSSDLEDVYGQEESKLFARPKPLRPTTIQNRMHSRSRW